MIKRRVTTRSENKINILEVVDLYKERPITIIEIARKYRVCSTTMSRILKENGCKIYSRQEINNNGTDIDYFETIDTEDKAYFLGLIIADGCVFVKPNGSKFITVGLQNKDLYMIERFKNTVKANREIVMDNRGNYGSITITSDKMVDDLSKYGVVPNKSRIAYLPNIHEDYTSDLIRGIFDGDGSIYKTKKGKGQGWRVAFSGSKQVIESIKENLVRELDLRDTKIYFQKNIYSISWYSVEDVKKLHKYLYGNGAATTYLHRKRERFEQFKEYVGV